ncbi:MAG: aspartate-semialdehyde dehydrogenase [Lentisphaeria bacterium]|nr:aspartate-semialdehyde dehydrogenase [Lentisphaeria bacterium]NQZ67310.1 aspartate-semialdehyde dehydrogenase [Lentisphaeria bacterium]
MSREFNVAVAGATGAVGVEMLKVLEERNFPVKSLKLLASSRSAGKTMTFKGETLTIEELTHDSFEGIDIALFSAGGGRSIEFAPSAVKAGAVVIDNSSAFRMDDEVPLIVPEVNPEAVSQHKGIIANPNCTTIIMLVALKPLHDISPIKRIVVSTYQSASGAGAAAMQELEEQTADLLEGKDVVPKVLQHQIAFNIFSHNSEIQENGYCEEEMKMVHETHKILGDDSIQICPTCVRVPIPRAHSEAITIEQETKVSVADATEAINNAPGVYLMDDRQENIFPMPIDVSGKYDVAVGRIRDDISHANGLALFCSGDQLLKGAALNAVQIAELL